ncbi:MAG TPA: calcium-binding protein [Acidimicrobiales bacterium]|nr:calcium-binding protein [Acidimicrobiales bacterium]
MIAEAAVDCYNESEAATGFLTMIEENLAVPFESQILGDRITVEGIDITGCGEIVAICARNGFRQAIPLLDLPLPRPAPEGAQWIDAYRRWRV